MTGITPTSDDHLFRLLREADPLGDSARLPTSDEKDRLRRRILATDRPATMRAGSHRFQRRRLVVVAASAGSIAAATTALVVALTAGSAPSVAFAGWSANPGVPAHAQVQAAEAECRRNVSLTSLTAALADTRGPYTLLVYAENAGYLCITGPSLQSPTGEPSIVPFGSFLSASMAAGQGATEEHGQASTQTQSRPAVAAGAISPAATGSATTASASRATFSFDVGRAGTSVSAVTLLLANGDRVEATTANGWFVAWWPGSADAQRAELTTTSGVVTQALVPPGTPGSTSPEATPPSK